MKKIVSLFMAVIMIFSIAVPSFAASAADAAQPAYASSADAASTTDDAASDAIGGVVDFFKKAIDAIVDFFRWLFGLDKNVAEYKIVFYDGSTVINTMVVEEGEEIPSPTIPRKTGHTFIGWSPALPEIMPSYDLEVKALWSINKYTITFDSNGGTDVESITQNYGSEIVAPADPVRSGYKFMGWQIWDSSVNAWVTTNLPEYMPANNVTYKAAWNETTYNITFYKNAGDSEPYYIISGKSYQEAIELSEKPADPVLDGHTFVGWDHPIPDIMPAKNMEITAVWAENDYTVSFVADGKVLSGFPLTAKYGTVIDDIPSAPAKEGHTFAGWTDENGNRVTVSSVIKKDITYYASYTANTYNVNWKINGETKTTKVAYGSSIIAPTVVAKEGYTFVGWEPAIPEKMPAKDLTFTAVFDAKEVTITFKYDDGSVYKTVTQDYETKVTAPAAPEKEGYTFTGWDQKIPSTMPAEDMTITASFKINQYTIKFEDTGDVAYASITQDYNTAIAAVANPVKEGHTFIGWDKTIPSKMPAENLTITAQWKVNQYTVTFETNGGSAIAPVTQNYGTALAAPATPTKSDYEFIGWATVASPSVDDKVDLPATIPAENVTYYAIWRGAEKTVIFNSNRGTFDTSVENTTATKHTKVIRNGEKLAEYVGGEYAIDDVKFPVPTRIENGVEYKVLYWSTDSSFKADMSNKIPDILELSSSTESVEYWAQWTQAYSITLYDGTKEIKSETLPAGIDLTEFMNIDEYAEESRKGYTFSYWAVKGDDGKLVKAESIFKAMPEEEVVYYAVWTANEYTLTFDAGEGTFGEKIGSVYSIEEKYTMDISSEIPEEDVNVENAKVYNPTREGFTFQGWTLEEDLDYKDVEVLIGEERLSEVIETIPEKMPREDKNYYALWSRNEYSAKYYILSDDGKTETLYSFETTEINEETEEETTVIKSADYLTKYGTAVEIPEVDPVKKGYEFIGWFDTKEAEGGNSAEDIVMPAKDIKIYARFAKTYSFSFANCGNVETITAKPGDDVTEAIKALEPTKKGHEFTGWAAPDGKVYTSNAALASAYPAMTEKDLTFVAEWETNVYTIEFDTNGGSEIASITLPFDAEIEAPAAPTKTGYTFEAWVDENGNNVSIPERMPVNGFKCIAKWKVNEYTITFDAVDGKFADGQSKATVTVNYGDVISDDLIPDAPQKYGYLFDAWTPGIPVIMPAEDKTVTASYVPGDYTAKFYTTEEDEANGVAYHTEGYKFGDEIKEPAAPSRDGYTFEGWSLKWSQDEADEVELGKINGNAVFYAIWVPNEVTIKFVRVNDEGKTESIDVTYNNKCDEGTDFPEIEGTKTEKDKNGVVRTYTLYWTVSGKNLVVKHGEAKTPCVSDSTLTYIENWVVDTFTIEFNSNGGSAVSTKLYNSGDRISEPAAPTKTGYKFVKWVIDDGSNDTANGDDFAWKEESGLNGVRIYESVKLEAVWTEDTFTVIWDVDGAREVDDDVLFNSAIEKPADPEKPGYKFAGWTPEIPETMPAEDITFVATWTAETYDATFDANGGAWAGEVTEKVVSTKFGETIKAPASPAKIGYTFGGWSPAVGEMDAVGGKTFKAIWNAAGDTKYVVRTHKMGTDGAYETTIVELSGETGTTVEATYTLDKGFELNVAKSTPKLSGVVAADGSLVIDIYLDRISYDVTVDGEIVMTCLYGCKYPGPGLPAGVEEECFEGWYITETNTEAVFPITVTKDINIESRLKAYTILFATEGGETVAPLNNVEVYTDIYSVTKDIEATRDGYSFVGWTDNKNAEIVNVIGKKEYSIKMPNNDLTLYAVWQENKTENA